ncbi:T-cell surface glycoprotein CD8 beta chain-like [Sander lucioperca]|uniref:T-cell surface glycoprotein CD8 beta chain-like n=1 Tax=Sander lucioperca TaxID=283035 RepID=UPI00125CD912|nr:T-cell surface glycoprotein CD8 beta chain-like [Sander lucioperca]
MFKLRMRNFTLITALLLCSLSWISVSASESHTVEVQSGGDVTLMCSNISSTQTHTEWFRVINRTKPSCVSSMYGSDSEALHCDGFENGFKMSSNISTVFLNITRVNSSHSGLYFCGFNQSNHIVLGNAIYLQLQDGMTNIMNVILTVLTVFLTIVIIVLAVKIRKLQTAVNEELQPERNKDLGSDELNYAALNFQAQPKRSRRPASEREMEPHVVYAATR